MRKLAVISVFVTLFSFCGKSQNTTQQTDSVGFIVSVDAQQFKLLADSVQGIVLDVRTPAEFASGHILNALNLDVNAASFTEQIAELPKDTTIFVYCRSGKRSLTAADILQKNGFTKIYNLKGGILSWMYDVEK